MKPYIIKERVKVYQKPCEAIYEYSFGDHIINVFIFGKCTKCEQAVQKIKDDKLMGDFPEIKNKGRVITLVESKIPF